MTTQEGLVEAPEVLSWRWMTVVALIGVATGFGFAAPTWTNDFTPYLLGGFALVGLATATVISHLRVHPWWGLLGVHVGFMTGMTPPLSNDDALWLVAVVWLGFLAAVYLALVNLLVMGALHLRRRRTT